VFDTLSRWFVDSPRMDRGIPGQSWAGVVLSPIAGVWLVLAVTALGGGPAHADVVYQWTDRHGVVHFSDVPPEGGPEVQRRELPAAPAPPTAAPAPASTPGGTPAGQDSSTRPGTAGVVLASGQSSHIAPAAVHAVGTVRNDGDAPARGVTVVLSASDAGQNNPCLEHRLAVQPSELAPHESGAFDEVVESPCLFGEPPVQLQPAWE
jgi:hypothetical protein